MPLFKRKKEDARTPRTLFAEGPLAKVCNVVAIASAKGGVGKSTLGAAAAAEVRELRGV